MLRPVKWSILLLLIFSIFLFGCIPETPPCVGNCCAPYCITNYTYSCQWNTSFPTEKCDLYSYNESICTSFTACYWGANASVTNCTNSSNYQQWVSSYYVPYVNNTKNVTINNYAFIVGNETGYTKINGDGYLTMYGNARTVDDLRFPANDLTVSGVSDPNADKFINNTRALYFSGSAMNQAFITIQMPHSRDITTNLSHHFHFASAGATTNNTYVTWCLEYSCVSINSIFPYTDIKCVNTTVSTEAYKHYMSNPIISSGDNLNASAMCNERIYRDGAGDSNNQEMALLEYDVHYVINSQGNKIEDYDFGI